MSRATIFEEHSSVLAHWSEQGWRSFTLVTLDAHLDLQFADPSRIERLRACASGDQLRALEASHPLCPDRSSCFGIEDFLYPASRLGLLRRVVWVAPPHVAGAGLVGGLAMLQQMEGVTLEDIESFHRTEGGWVEGRLLGVSLIVCELRHLHALPLDGELRFDIDVDYFITVPGDEVWADPRAVVGLLRARAGPGAELTIARSVGTGFTPLRHRFLADLLSALWEGREDAAADGLRLLALTRNGSASDADRAALRGEREQRAGDAAVCHALGVCEQDPSQRSFLLQRACELDAAYGDDILRSLCEFRARRLPLTLRSLETLRRQVLMLRDTTTRLATAWTALGMLEVKFNHVREAVRCDDTAKELLGSGHPELALEIAKLMLRAGPATAAAAQPYLDRALADDETRVGARLYCGEALLAAGALDQALEQVQAAHRAAPAWADLLKRIAGVHRQRGDGASERNALSQFVAAEDRVRKVAQRLAA